jgi:replicative DNA helicase
MTDDNETANISQGKRFGFDRSFQEKIVQALLLDRSWASQINEVLDVSYFDYEYLRIITDKYLSYWKEYKEFPSHELLVSLVKKHVATTGNTDNVVLLEQLKNVFRRAVLKSDMGDLVFVKNRTLDFCKRVGLQQALTKSVDLIDSEEYDKIVDVVKRALIAGQASTVGLSLSDDIAVRYSETARRTIATGIAEFDRREVLNGGLGGGELGVLVGPPGSGKSHWLVHVGAQALLQGKNVVHYTFELSERALGVRYDSHLLNISSLDCWSKVDEIKEFYKTNEGTLGRHFLKYYPTGTASIMTIRAHLERLASREGFIPDLIITDYAGIMRSMSRHELMRIEHKRVFEEHRELAAELDVPIWTVVQSNKQGAEEDIVCLENMAESYAQAAIADFVIGFSRKALLKTTGQGGFFIAKNRAGIDGLKYTVHVDTARSKFKVIRYAEQLDETSDLSEQARDKLRQQIAEMVDKQDK